MSYKERLVSIAKLCGADYEEDCDLSALCSYRTGGRADCRISPATEEQLKTVVEELKAAELPYFYLGCGSNVLASDEGYRGAVICTDKLKGLSVNGKIITAYAGEKVADLVKFALMCSLGGAEFLNGIPASVGGVVAMNAGCYGKSVADICSYAVSASGVYAAKDCGFAYRGSRFKKTNDGVIKAAFHLENAEYDQSEAKAEYYRNLRKNKQPKGRSCGSTFKNDGYYAGKVIESCNLKGVRIGSARISEKHANFILADPKAKSADIYSLINLIKKTVKDKTGIELEEEIEFLGSFSDENKF